MEILNNCLPYILIISALSGILTEALKNLLDNLGFNYSSNILAGISSVIVTVAFCILYVVYMEIDITGQLVCNGLVLLFFSWVGSMVGFDKVVQTIKQIEG